jgi:hypothetical protein
LNLFAFGRNIAFEMIGLEKTEKYCPEVFSL